MITESSNMINEELNEKEMNRENFNTEYGLKPSTSSSAKCWADTRKFFIRHGRSIFFYISIVFNLVTLTFLLAYVLHFVPTHEEFKIARYNETEANRMRVECINDFRKASAEHQERASALSQCDFNLKMRDQTLLDRDQQLDTTRKSLITHQSLINVVTKDRDGLMQLLTKSRDEYAQLRTQYNKLQNEKINIGGVIKERDLLKQQLSKSQEDNGQLHKRYDQQENENTNPNALIHSSHDDATHSNNKSDWWSWVPFYSGATAYYPSLITLLFPLILSLVFFKM